MAKNRPTHAAKETRLSIRVDAARKAVIARAAKLHGDTIINFVLEKLSRWMPSRQAANGQQSSRLAQQPIDDTTLPATHL